MPDQWVTKLSFQHLQLYIFNKKGVTRVKEEKFPLPVDVRRSKTSVLKLPNNNTRTAQSLSSFKKYAKAELMKK